MKEIDTLIADARTNERTLRRFQALELALMGCASLPAFVSTLIEEGMRHLQTDAVTLTLLDPDHEIRRLLESSGVAAQEIPGLDLIEAAASLAALYGPHPSPIVGPCNKRYAALFGPAGDAPASLCLLPIARADRLLGSLHLGSRSAMRFPRRAATDFLQHLAAVIAVCLESAVLRERLKVAGFTDGLTAVYNRRYFEQRLPEEVARSVRLRGPLCCLVIDIDHFKRINDDFGHPTGDEVLRTVARLIRAQLRTNDLVARYGGEEFVVLMGQTTPASATEIAERIRGAIQTADVPVLGRPPRRISVSVGAASLIPGGGEREHPSLGADLVTRADRALYLAKRGGRNRVVSDDSQGGSATARSE
ncbi:MAG: DUF484 family protein [Gammaproteobacteria bacterium]